jgi:hypothetical protein
LSPGIRFNLWGDGTKNGSKFYIGIGELAIKNALEMPSHPGTFHAGKFDVLWGNNTSEWEGPCFQKEHTQVLTIM